MEMPGAAYLYAVAGLAITFTGFCSIVFVLRPTRDTAGTHLHRLISRAYIEFGFTAAAAAMLPPLLYGCGLSLQATWTISSAVIAAALIFHTYVIYRRFLSTAGWRGIPLRAHVFSVVTMVVILILLANAVGFLFPQGPGPIMIAATWRLVMGATLFVLTFESYLAGDK